MKQYLDTLRLILGTGTKRDDRTGVGTISVFGLQMRYNLSDRFPMITTKKVWFKGIVHELLWFLKGDTNIKYLTDNGVHIWDEWARDDGDLGPIYGKQWRGGRGKTDQIKNIIDSIKYNPYSRRHIVSAWNVGEISEMALPPCHYSFQFYIDNKKLSCMFNMRSCDIFLGAPFNIASYALLTHMIAQVCDLEVGTLIMSIGDAHMYNNHMDQVVEQLLREPMELPRLWLNPTIKDIDAFKYEDIKLLDYKSHPAISAPIAV